MQKANPMRKFKNLRNQAGTTLIEILVSVIILAIGMLGLAAMQNTSLRFSYDSYVRTQASFLAYDLIDRIRANPDANLYTLDATQTIAQQNCFSGDTCTPAQIRQFDLHYWQQQVNQLLPDATVAVTFDNTQNIYTMTLSWEDRVENDVVAGETKVFTYPFKIDN